MLRLIAVTIVSMAAVGSTTTRTVGNLRVTVHQGEYEAYKPEERTSVRIERSGATVWRGAFDFARGVHIIPLEPLVVVTSDGVRADGIQIEAHLLAWRGRKLHDMMTPLSIDAQDAICVSRDHKTLLVAVQTDEKCVMCWPKQFVIHEHAWRDAAFVSTRTWTTKREYRDGSDAIRNEAGGCAVDIVKAVLNE